MDGAIDSAVERYLVMTGKTIKNLRNVATPCMDDGQFAPTEFYEEGEVSENAAKIVLKALYAARVARPELLWAVNTLAREVTKWTKACDRRLHRLMSYMHFHKQDVLTAHAGDQISDCKIMMFADASFAGDLRDSKSTSGMYMAIAGPHTWVPLAWLCKKQTAVSHSSAEAEIIALDAGMRMEALPMMELWNTALDVFDPPKDHHKPQPLVPRPPRSINDYLQQVDEVPPNARPTSNRGVLIILEDNDSVIKMCLKQRIPRLKYVPRTHRVDLDALINQIAKDPQVIMRFVKTHQQAADIFTKGSFNEITWKRLQNLIQLGQAKPRKKAALPPTEAFQSKQLSEEELPEPTTPTKVKPTTSWQDQTPEKVTWKEPMQLASAKPAVSSNRTQCAARQTCKGRKNLQYQDRAIPKDNTSRDITPCGEEIPKSKEHEPHWAQQDPQRSATTKDTHCKRWIRNVRGE